MSHLQAAATQDNYPRFRVFALRQAEKYSLPLEKHSKLELVLEELLVNVINYAYPDDRGEIELSCFMAEVEGQQSFCVALRDWGPPFDPTQDATPATATDVEECRIGGLGVFLVQQMADSLTYTRESDSNLTTVSFAV